MIVRSETGAEASEVKADHRRSFSSGVTATDSRVRIVAAHSAAQARSPASSIRASGCKATGALASPARAPPRSCQSPPMASAAARIEPPKSKANTWAPA